MHPYGIIDGRRFGTEVGRSTEQSSSPARFEFVDALRRLAVVYVTIFLMINLPKYEDAGPELGVPHWPEAVAQQGFTAVTLFFIISVFSLCHTVRARRASGTKFMTSTSASCFGLHCCSIS